MKKIPFSCLLLLITIIVACSGPQWQPVSNKVVTPSLNEEYAIMGDGYTLPLSFYDALNAKATVIALHGFNDYRNGFNDMCSFLAKQGINCMAYDQRGFGQTQHTGLWPKNNAFQKDLISIVELVKQRNPNQPIYLMGESMGGAIIMTAAKQPNTLVDGIILLAPAVWARSTQPWYQRMALAIAINIAPSWTPTGEGLEVTPTDNRPALKKMWHDPLVIKKTRIDTLYGLNNLMDSALASADQLANKKGLLLYGKKDELIPRKPTCKIIDKLSKSEYWQITLYDEGYHMLTRDLQREKVFKTVTDWILQIKMPESASSNVDLEQFCAK